MSKKVKIIIAASVAVAVVLVAALGIWLAFVFKSDGKKSGEPVITVGVVQGSVGKTVSVPVEIKDNPGVMGLAFEFGYDNTALEFISVEKGNVITDCESNESDGVIKTVTVEDGDVEKDGAVMHLKFKVKDGADGMSEIKINSVSMCNYDEETITAETEDGGVEIKN